MIRWYCIKEHKWIFVIRNAWVSCQGSMRYWFWPACVAVSLYFGVERQSRLELLMWIFVLRALFDRVCENELIFIVLCILNSACPALWAHDSALNHHQMPWRSHWSRWWIYSSLLVILLRIFWAFYTDLISRHNFLWVRLTSCSRNGYDFSRRLDPDLRFCWVSEMQGLTVASIVYSFVASLLFHFCLASPRRCNLDVFHYGLPNIQGRWLQCGTCRVCSWCLPVLSVFFTSHERLILLNLSIIVRTREETVYFSSFLHFSWSLCCWWKMCWPFSCYQYCYGVKQSVAYAG